MNEPQLSAEMEHKFNEDFTVAEIWGMPLPDHNGRKIIYEDEALNAIKEHNKKIKHFLATALEEQKQGYLRKIGELDSRPLKVGEKVSTAREVIDEIVAILSRKGTE